MLRAGPKIAFKVLIYVTKAQTNMARGKHRRYMELVAYHIYHLENRTQVIPWREVTPAMVAKYEAFSRQCVEDYLRKKEEPEKVFVQQEWEK